MRRPFALSLLLLATILAPLAPPAAAAAEAPLADPTGDVAIETGADARVAAPAGVADAIDLTGLAFDETDDALGLVLTLAGLEASTNTASEYFIDFAWGRAYYTVYIARWSFPGVGESTWAFLAQRPDASPAQNGWELDGVAPLEPEFDASTSSIRITIPKAYVLDAAQRPPVKGESLTDVAVHAARRTFGFTIMDQTPGALRDRMPDEGAAAYTFTKGDESSGNVLLRSHERVRVSNGGATTFVFQATIENLGEMDDEFRLSLVDMPAGWNGSVEERVRVPAKSDLTLPVLATVPFAHDHGGFTSFGLQAESTTDAGSSALLRLGVLHTPIPQPAGHHNELCLHAPPGSESVFATFWSDPRATMNTLCEHDAEAEEVPASQWADGMWAIPLGPALKMGLDFDVDGVGTLVGSVIGRQMGDAEVRAQLMLVGEGGEQWVDFGEGLVLAESDVQTIALDVQNPTPFSLTLTPTPEADYIPHMSGQNLVLVMSVDPTGMRTTCCVKQNMPSLVTRDWKLTLPLNEYHDRITSARSDVASPLSLVADGPVEKIARPGAVAAYAFTLRNDASREITVDLDLAGTHADAGTIAPRHAITLAPGESHAVTLGVRIPDEAAADELIEVLVFAHAVEDPSLAAVARTVTRVGLGSDAGADESAVLAAAQEEDNDTPAPGPLAALAALGAAAIALRHARRRS